jgi:hypothetical protein
MPARAYGRSNAQGDCISAQNFSVSPKKPSARLPARYTRIFRGLSSLSLWPIRTHIWYRRFRFGVRAVHYTVTSGRLR